MKKKTVEASLLLVDDDPSVIQALSRILSDYSPVRFATSGADALRLCRETLPDLILLDAQMGDMSGLQVCEALKGDASLADAPVIFVSSHQEAELEVAVLELGAVDFIRKPFNAQQVLARVNTQLELKRLSDDLRRQSRVDGPTGLPNGRAYNETLAREISRAVESGQDISVALLDIDFFESFEALYDRKAAEACLGAVGDALQGSARRPGDFAARLEGERLALILPDTSADDALHVANRALRAVESMDIPHQGSAVSRHITCSAGVACLDADARVRLASVSGTSMQEALEAAARTALSQAVAAGRAQAAAAVPAPPPADEPGAGTD